MMKFDVVVGNPPYQEETTNNHKIPIYPDFYDLAYKISDEVALISPARFLFNTGLTNEKWNKKMLSDDHIKVLFYDDDATKVFPNTDIKGGVAIIYRNANIKFGRIGKYIKNNDIRSLYTSIHKVNFTPISDIMIGGRSDFLLNSNFHSAYPSARDDMLKAIQEKALKKGNKVPSSLDPGADKEIVTSTLYVLPYAFLPNKPYDIDNYYEVTGVAKGKRVSGWIRKEYITTRRPNNNNINYYKVFIPKSMASGKFGEKLSKPLIGNPGTTSTPTFLRIGMFDSKNEAENCAKYIKTRFLCAMLGINKITQDNPVPKWKDVPLQDFTNESDIDWNKSINDIDHQLYSKYNFSSKEINFIENNVYPIDD